MIALCLSGGGFRATLFHLGALRRLNELGVLSQIDTFSSVSGGSILNGVLATRWPELAQSASGGVFADFDKLIARPLTAFCQNDLRTPLFFCRRSGTSLTELLANQYARCLSLGVALSELPASPRFIFCATNMATGANWEFETGPAGRMGDYKSQSMPTGSTTVARAVAASSAFPVTFPLLRIKQRKKTAWLSDGGVYDNLGMEPVWKTHQIVLVSDAGQPLRQEPGYHHWQLRLPFVGWAARLNRVFEVVLNQVAAVRKRWFIAVLCSPNRPLSGTYWGIATDYQDYGLADGRGYPPAVVKLLKAVRTDLNAFSNGEIGCLENHGYALTDTALRRWLPKLLPDQIPPFNYPYPNFVDEQTATAALADSASRTLWRDFCRWLWSSSAG